jgi:hypothetical protein
MNEKGAIIICSVPGFDMAANTSSPLRGGDVDGQVAAQTGFDDRGHTLIWAGLSALRRHILGATYGVAIGWYEGTPLALGGGKRRTALSRMNGAGEKD